MGEIQTVNEIEEKKEAEEKMEQIDYLETEENKEVLKEIRGQVMKHYGKCKECKRTDKTYKDFCFWCYIEKTREIAQELSSEISNNGRSSLIDTEKIKIIRNKLLELV
jgi:hypothetical protein